jgi:hypothetical protein
MTSGDWIKQVAAAASLAGVEQWRTRRTSVPPSFESLFIEELSRSLTQSVLPKGAWFQALANSFTPVVKSVSSLRDPGASLCTVFAVCTAAMMCLTQIGIRARQHRGAPVDPQSL